MAFTSLFLDTSTGSVTSGMGSYISDLSKTIGVDLFEEDIDNVVFRTNEFLCSADFIGSDGPFWYILQMSMALGALFSIIVAGSMSYKMLVKGEPIDVVKIMKVLGISLVMCFWYPSSTNNNGSILDALAFIPNCIGSYTHDLYEAEAVQVSEKYNELMPLIQKRDSMYHKIAPTQKVAKEIILSEIVQDASMQIEDIGQKQEGEQLAQEAADRSIFAGLIIGLDKIVMFLALVIYRIGWWSTISASRFSWVCSQFLVLSNGLSPCCPSGKVHGLSGLPVTSRCISMVPCFTLLAFTSSFSLILLSVYRWRTSLLSRQEKEKLQDISKMPS